VFEEEVQRVICAHAAAGGHHPYQRQLAVLPDERDDFVDNVAVIGLVAVIAAGRRQPPIVPGFAVHAVDGEELDFPELMKPSMADTIPMPSKS